MTSDFEEINKLYDNNNFVELLNHPNGVFWLKLRSISRTEQLKQFCKKIGLDITDIPVKKLFEYAYNQKPNDQVIEQFIQELFQLKRAERKQNEDFIISQLYQMKVFDWGGLYQNSLERTIVNNYIKKIQNWDALNFAIDNVIHSSMRGYIQSSWYNHWSSILIEDIFKDHQAVLPTTGLVKKLDFFIHDFPFDLKVTYLPKEYYEKELRKSEGLRPELTDLKAFCRKHKIWFDPNSPDAILFSELLNKIKDDQSQAAQDFIGNFELTRASLLKKALENQQALKVWLYENQGDARFDAANRFFLVLVDGNNFEESWKLKRQKNLLINSIHAHLDSMNPDNMKDLKLKFSWKNKTYETYADILFVVVNQK